MIGLARLRSGALPAALVLLLAVSGALTVPSIAILRDLRAQSELRQYDPLWFSYQSNLEFAQAELRIHQARQLPPKADRQAVGLAVDILLSRREGLEAALRPLLAPEVADIDQLLAAIDHAGPAYD